jgi:hypothetical protein
MYITRIALFIDRHKTCVEERNLAGQDNPHHSLVVQRALPVDPRRITILAHAEPGEDEEFGATVGQVAAGLRKGSHRVSVLGVQNNIGRLISGMKRRQPDLIFNLMDREPTEGPRSAAIVGLLDLLGIPYTGSCPGQIYIQEDPGIVRKLLGLSADAAPKVNDHWAREFRVGVVGNDETSALEPVPVGGPTTGGGPPALTERMQDDNALIRNERLRKDLMDTALVAYRALRVRDYGIVNLRVINRRDVEPIDVRTDCDLGECGELARAAEASGLGYVGLVNRIAEAAMTRAEQRQIARLI